MSNECNLTNNLTNSLTNTLRKNRTSNLADNRSNNLTNNLARAITPVAFLNSDLLTCWYRLAWKLLFNKFVHRLEHMGRPNTRPILALKAY